MYQFCFKVSELQRMKQEKREFYLPLKPYNKNEDIMPHLIILKESFYIYRFLFSGFHYAPQERM